MQLDAGELVDALSQRSRADCGPTIAALSFTAGKHSLDTGQGHAPGKLIDGIKGFGPPFEDCQGTVNLLWVLPRPRCSA